MEEKGLIAFEWEDTEACVGMIADWFGIPRSFFSDYRILRSNTKTLNIVNADIQVERKPAPDAVGMPFLHTNMAVHKLTQPAALFLGPHCTRNIVQLDRARAVAYMGRQSVEIREEDLQACDGPGYVMVGYDGRILGLGFRHRERPMILESFMPKAWAVGPGVDPF
jgi:NOL1/NOP2/fmu family ribosome biogenesis protein